MMNQDVALYDLPPQLISTGERRTTASGLKICRSAADLARIQTAQVHAGL